LLDVFVAVDWMFEYSVADMSLSMTSDGEKNKQATTTNQQLNPTDIMEFELRIFVPWVDSQCFLRTAVHDFRFCALAHSWLFLG